MHLASTITPETYKEEGIDVGRNHPYLPLRPIIIGGDDVTFVCHARLAVVLAQAFMKELEVLSAKELGKLGKNNQNSAIHSCAGIAILNASYPFFRGYELAEQMCGKAKEQARKEKSSWLDFIILHGEQAPTVEQIREQEYTSIKGGQLHFGPYVVSEIKNKEYALQNMVDLVNGLQTSIDTTDMGRNKVKGLRYILQGTTHGIQEYVAQLTHRGKSLPSVEDWNAYAKYGWKAEYLKANTMDEAKAYSTPYIDAIEMMDYLPSKAFWNKFESQEK